MPQVGLTRSSLSLPRSPRFRLKSRRSSAGKMATGLTRGTGAPLGRFPVALTDVVIRRVLLGGHRPALTDGPVVIAIYGFSRADR